MDDWFVPGAFIDEGDRKIRLHPNPNWPRFILEVRRRPLSMNTNVGHGHWSGFHGAKKGFQEEITTELMVAGVSRRGYQRAVAGAFIRFNRRFSRNPDPGNYATLVNKALGDALVEYGAIPDDDAPHYVFGGVEFEDEIGPARTRIYVYLQPT